MGFDKFYRTAVGKQSRFQETIVCRKAALTAMTGAGTPYSVLNPEGTPLLVTMVVVDITGAVSDTPVEMNVGIGAAATAAYDTLIDGADIGTPTAADVYNNADDGGTNGQAAERWSATEYLTVTVTGTPTGLVGNIYYWYRKV